MEMAVEAGNAPRTHGVAAAGAGRRVDTVVRRGVVEVSEVTRRGSPRAAWAVGEALAERPVPRGRARTKR